MPPAAFSAVTGLVQTEPNRFAADVHPEWTIGGKPNGGDPLAPPRPAPPPPPPPPPPLPARPPAAAPPPPPRTAASPPSLPPPDPGRVEVHVEVPRAGRAASQVRPRLEQGDRVCVEALLTLSELDPDSKPYWTDGVPEP